MISKLFLLLFLALAFISFENVYADTLSLEPTDDAFVLTDLDDANLPAIEKINTGDLEYLKIGFATNNTASPSLIISAAFLKFDLSNLSEDNIGSAKLQLYANNVLLSAPQKVGIYLVDDSTWDESTLTYDSRPILSDLISTATIDSGNFYQWELGDIIKQYAGEQLSLLVSPVTLFQDTENIIIFVSKDLENPEFSPILDIEINEELPKSTKLFPTDDSFIMRNFMDTVDSDGIADLNMGNRTAINIWYSRNTTDAQELVFASGFLKFNVSALDFKNIQSATLNMYQSDSVTTNADRLVSVFSVDDDDWDESKISYTNSLNGTLMELDTISVVNTNNWYSWNITDAVKQSDEYITLTMTFKNIMLGHEEQAIFSSKESAITQKPYIEILYLNDDESQVDGGGCLIATAAYGSELTPRVQALREIRDNQLLQTESGTSFMILFNDVYYSFSPYVADLERQNPMFKEIVKIGITPLLSSLSILNYVEINSEESVLGYGISLIVLNLSMYFVAPVMLFCGIRKYVKKFNI